MKSEMVDSAQSKLEKERMMESLVNRTWNKRLTVLRNYQEWTQNEAAMKCCTNRKNYWQWEKGEVEPNEISKKFIAAAFGLSVVSIFGE